MKLRNLIAFALVWACAQSAVAGQLAGKNIILVQGFQFQHVFLSRTHDDGKRFGFNYWNRFDLYNNGNGAVKVARPTGITLLDQNLPLLKTASGRTFNIYDTSRDAKFYDDANAKILHYDSTYRIEGSDGIGRTIAGQIEDLFDEDPTFCTRTNGCIVITHSTGDLVMQYIEENKRSLLDSSTRSAFDVTTYIDLAGARGGTEGATVLFGLANFLNSIASNTVLSPSKRAEISIANQWINLFLGSRGVEYLAPGKQFQSGVLYNLQPRQARNTGLGNPDRVPHLRVASAGKEPYGFITQFFIKGKDDSVVPMHSACGSTRAESYNSCVRTRKLNGERTSFADAPRSLYNLHFPFIQSEKLRHNGHQWDDTGNSMVPLASNGRFAGDVDIDLESQRRWNLFMGTYYRIPGAENKTMAQVLATSVE